jgi:hypothetical protein
MSVANRTGRQKRMIGVDSTGGMFQFMRAILVPGDGVCVTCCIEREQLPGRSNRRCPRTVARTVGADNSDSS